MDAVHVWEGIAVKRTLTDVDGALRFLDDLWPAGFDDTVLYHAAVGSALAVIEQGGPVDAFRAALVAAAEEAGILAEAPVLPPRTPATVARPWQFTGKRRRR